MPKANRKARKPAQEPPVTVRLLAEQVQLLRLVAEQLYHLRVALAPDSIPPPPVAEGGEEE